MNQEISLLILIEVKPKHRQKQIDAFNKIAPIVLKENGCLQYELKEVENKENEFVIIEKWATEKDLLAHDVAASHMVESDNLNPTFRAKPTTVIKLLSINE